VYARAYIQNHGEVRRSTCQLSGYPSLNPKGSIKYPLGGGQWWCAASQNGHLPHLGDIADGEKVYPWTLWCRQKPRCVCSTWRLGKVGSAWKSAGRWKVQRTMLNEVENGCGSVVCVCGQGRAKAANHSVCTCVLKEPQVDCGVCRCGP